MVFSCFIVINGYAYLFSGVAYSRPWHDFIALMAQVYFLTSQSHHVEFFAGKYFAGLYLSLSFLCVAGRVNSTSLFPLIFVLYFHDKQFWI